LHHWWHTHNSKHMKITIWGNTQRQFKIT
jgi:hypothetical protein